MTRISARYLGWRLVVSYFTLLVIMTLMFVLVRSMPGSFIGSMLAPGMPPSKAEALAKEWGLYEPLWKKYLKFMLNYQIGAFGFSPTEKEPVWDIIIRRTPRTVILFGVTFLVGIILGPLVGMYLGWWRGTTRDKAIYTGGLLGYSMPLFWIAWLFIWALDYELEWLPSTYMLTQFPKDAFGASFEWTALTVMGDVLRHIALPLITISFLGWVGPMLIMRTQMNNVTDEDYVFLAQAKGLSERTVMIKHAARNALIPVATSAIVGIAFILDGSVIVENVFTWPGLGQVILSSVLNRDFPIMQAAFFMLAVLIVVMRFLTDVAYTYLDPRIKFGGQG